MFMLSMGAGMDLGFPDVCLTPAPPIPSPVPIPYPDVAVSATTAPAAYNVLVDCMPSINQMSMGLVSNGDEPGIAGGVSSHLIDGQARYEVGCFTILVDGVPAQRLTSVTGQNSMGMLPNAPGMCLCPSQVTVLTLG
jgi:Toxin PAAR-like domain